MINTTEAARQLASMPILVLAGGFGTRLKSVVQSNPKPLAPVGDKTFLDILIRSLYRQGFRHIDLSLHHEAEQIVRWSEKTDKPKDLKIRCATEAAPLGTAGAIAFAREHFSYSGDLFVCNGDTYLNNGAVEILMQNYIESSMAVVKVSDSSRYGRVQFNKQSGFIEKFVEKNEVIQPAYINSGLYLLKTELLGNLEVKSHSLEREIFPNLVQQQKLRAVALKSLFIDIGIPEDYNLFVQMVQNKEVLESW